MAGHPILIREDKPENRSAHASGPFGGADRAGRMTGIGAQSAPPTGANVQFNDARVGFLTANGEGPSVIPGVLNTV